MKRKTLTRILLLFMFTAILLTGCKAPEMKFDTADEAKEALDSICKEKIEYDESQRVCEKGEVIFFIPFNHLY